MQRVRHDVPSRHIRWEGFMSKTEVVGDILLDHLLIFILKDNTLQGPKKPE